MPQVSIIIPAYNCEKTISDAIASVQMQSFGDWELVVVDDCSKDDTVTVSENFAAKDTRIKIVRSEKNGGPAVARNIGIDLSMGEYIAFLDADDIWLSKKLEKQIQIFRRTKCGLCYSSCFFMDKTSNSIGKEYIVPQNVDYKGLLVRNVIPLSTVVIKRDALGNERFSPQFLHEDYALWLNLLRSGISVYGVSETLAIYRTGGRSSNKMKAAMGRWNIYRKGENLSHLQSWYYLVRYAAAAVKKYW